MLPSGPIRLMGIPNRLHTASLPDDAVDISSSEDPEAIVLTEVNAARLIATRASRGGAAILPVMEVSTGQFARFDARRADVHIAAATRDALSDAIAIIRPMVDRLRSLAPSILLTGDARMLLLGRLVVRDRGIEPRRDPQTMDTFTYADESAIPGVAAHAEDLVRLGMLKREFVDVVTTCPRCGSGRLCARECCPGCGSTHLTEEAVIHHFRCAYQALEHEFRSPHGLVCPKCRRQLEHFSVDYDRPGVLAVCGACGRSSNDTTVSFLCLDCSAHYRSTEISSRRIYRYELTAAAHECVRSGMPLPQMSDDKDATSYRIRNFASRHMSARKPCSILELTLKPAGHATARPAQSGAFFASLIRETFVPDTEIIEADPKFLALLSGDSKSEVKNALPEIRRALEGHLSSSLKVDYGVFGPDEIERLL